jgi:diguanylate cyclase (GGDEF)-like protein/PAS domain S-box-containing protein
MTGMTDRIWIRALGTAAAYFGCAAAAIAFSRFQGGFSYLWLATGILTASLAATPRRDWWPLLILSAMASIVATTAYGMGSRLALPLAVINILEAAIGAWLLRRTKATPNTLDSLQSTGHFLLAVGFIAPAICAALGAATAYAAEGGSLARNWLVWFSGHSLGSITCTPLVLLLLKGEFGKWFRRVTPQRRNEAFMLYAMFTATTVYSFYQLHLPLLFLPLGPLTLICFRHDRVLPALSVLTLATVGVIFTSMDRGPLALVSAGTGERLQFLQFYLASVIVTILPVTADLNERRRLFRSLRNSKARYRLLLENSTDILLHLKPDGSIIYASPSIAKLAGYDPQWLMDRNALDLVEAEWQEQVKQDHASVLAAKGATVRFEYMARAREGDLRWFETQSRAVCNEAGQLESVVSVIRDIDARKHQEMDLVLEATRDALTGLPNRRAFSAAFNQSSEGTRSIALIDIDHFKRINDQYGHAAGDCALQTFAEIARRAVRRDDHLARVGGEEFAILFQGLSACDAQEICERVRAEISASTTHYAGSAIRFTISVGVADVIGRDMDATLASADRALYQAKRGGRDRLSLAA